MGALPPKYKFALNAHAEYRANRCPGCNAKTLLRKIPLVIHLAGVGLLVLRKSCRLCLKCEVVIAHQAELESSIPTTPAQDNTPPEYMVLGTTNPQMWRRGLTGEMSAEELICNMADFKSHLRVECTAGGWYR